MGPRAPAVREVVMESRGFPLEEVITLYVIVVYVLVMGGWVDSDG